MTLSVKKKKLSVMRLLPAWGFSLKKPLSILTTREAVAVCDDA
jgi:hypothetical protein